MFETSQIKTNLAALHSSIEALQLITKDRELSGQEKIQLSMFEELERCHSQILRGVELLEERS